MADENTIKEEVKIAPQIEVVFEPEFVPIEVPETPTAQIPVNEPLPTLTKTEADPVAETILEETKSVKPEIQSEPIIEPIPEPAKEIKPKPVLELIKPESKPVEQTSEVKPEPVSESNPEPKQETKPEPDQPKIIPIIIPKKNLARELLVKARNIIQFRKRKKLDKVMTLFAKQTKITNDEVEKFMHVSDATATRYLSQLEKEGKIKQSGKTGKSVFYSKL
jgi:hypothetical protein